MRSVVGWVCRVVALGMGLMAAPAWAQGTSSTDDNPAVDVQLFHPVAGATGFFSTESGQVNAYLHLSVGALLNYASEPLNVSILRVDGTKRSVGAVVENRFDLVLHGAVGLFEFGELGVAVPLFMQGGFEGSKFEAAGVSVGTSGLRASGQGDVRLLPKLRLRVWGDGLFAVAVMPTVVLPTAHGAAYVGEGGLVFEPAVAVSSRMGVVHIGANLGYRMRPRATVQTLVIDNELFFRAAASFEMAFGSGAPYELIGEIYGNTPASNPYGVRAQGRERNYELGRSPMELMVGVRREVFGYFLLSAGAGGGMLPGYGAALPRLFVSLQMYTGQAGPSDRDSDGVIDVRDGCPDRAEDRDGFQDDDGCPDLDNDNDRVLDEDDACPIEAEDRDGYNDEDGCPDVDNDGDGIADEADQCPSEVEDKDGFQDGDGCPDLDNDGDGIADAVDKCPDEAEDLDRFQDADGCPEADNDSDGLSDLNDLCSNYPEDRDGVDDDDGCPEDNDDDGIPDELDRCPNEAETYNGVADADGCPDDDQIKSLVQVSKRKIAIKQKVFFRAGRAQLDDRSFALLDQVVAVLRNVKQILKLRVEGHTDARGSAVHNRRLGEQRAGAVVAYLVSKGIEARRLEAVGVGPDQPVATNDTEAGREMNRRIALVIVEHAQYGKSVADPEVQVELDFDFGIKIEEAPPPADLEEGRDTDEPEILFELGAEEKKHEGKRAKDKTEEKEEEGEEEKEGEIQFDLEF